MTNLNSQMVEVLQGIRNEISVDKDGKGSITKYGLANLLGISRSLLNGDRMAKKLTERLDAKGLFDGDRDFKNGIPDVAVECIIDYYAFDAQTKSENAHILYRAFAAVGIRAWFQEIAGYEKPKPQTELERARQAYEYMGKMIAVMEYARLS